MRAKLVVNPIEVTNRLHELFGVSKEQLIEVVFKGIAARVDCTRHDPLSMPGIRCWGAATRGLRDLFVPLGWRADNTDNIPSVLHRRGHIKIAVTNSDNGTGIEVAHPQPSRDKGDGAQRAGFSNQGQEVFSMIADDSLNDVGPGGNSFWYLCIFCLGDMIRAEILCPILGADGSFKDFRARIALITENDDNGGFPVRRDIPESPNSDSGFEINVTRKEA